jgi:hypothetical protein
MTGREENSWERWEEGVCCSAVVFFFPFKAFSKTIFSQFL